jgi:hypothetical protein
MRRECGNFGGKVLGDVTLLILKNLPPEIANIKQNITSKQSPSEEGITKRTVQS